jgi:hypothetical protein
MADGSGMGTTSILAFMLNTTSNKTAMVLSSFPSEGYPLRALVYKAQSMGLSTKRIPPRSLS